MATMKAYVELLQEHGVGFEADPALLRHLCKTLERSAASCVDIGRDGVVVDTTDYVNMIASSDPDVAFMFTSGIMTPKEGGRAMLVLPPDWLATTRVRDAIWVEGDNSSVKRGGKPKRRREDLADGARSLCKEIQRVFATAGVPLGPRSFRCHQDYVLASTKPGALFDSLGRVIPAADAERHPHGHDAWERLVLVLPTPWPADVTLNVDVCTECGATTRTTTRLGLAIMPPVDEHKHSWTRFSAPSPDAKGDAGVVHGEVCLVESSEAFPGARPGRCMQTRLVRYEGREPVLALKPKWVGRDRPVLRPPEWARGGVLKKHGIAVADPERELILDAVRLPKGHVHVWDAGRYTFGPGAALPFLRCLTCECELWSNEIHGVSVPSVVKELNGRVNRAGGFARGDMTDLNSVLLEFRLRYNANGELAAFADQLALEGSCETGLPVVSPARRQSIWDVSHGQGETTWRKTALEITRDGRLHGVKGQILAEGQKNSYLVYKIAGDWEIAHMPSGRCFSVKADTLEQVKSLAEELHGKSKAPAPGARDAGIESVSP